MVLRLCRSSVRTQHGRSGPLPESGATVTGVRDRYHLANSRQKKKTKKITRTFVQSRGPHPAPLVVLRAVQLFVEGYPRALYDFDELQGDVQGDWNQGV